MATNYYKGVGANWAVGNTTYGITGGVLQTKDHSATIDEAVIQNENGNVIGIQGYNPTQTATLEFVVTGSTANGTATVPPAPDFLNAVTVTDTTNSNITGSSSGYGTWLFKGWSQQGSNTSALRIRYELARYMGMNA